MINQRFYVNEDHAIIDALHPDNKADGWYLGDCKDEMYLREIMLMAALNKIVRELIIVPTEVRGNMADNDYRLIEQANTISSALSSAIYASHLNTLDPALSLRNQFDGHIKREKAGMEHVTSLWLFADDIERLLRDVYGEADNQAIERARDAVFGIVSSFAKYLRRDLWQEHQDAQNIDYVCGFGFEGYGISGSDHRQAIVSANDLALRARSVSVPTRPPSASTPLSL
jgi:hypothetical protein